MWLWPVGGKEDKQRDPSYVGRVLNQSLKHSKREQREKQGNTGEHWGPVEMLEHNVCPHVKDTNTVAQK